MGSNLMKSPLIAVLFASLLYFSGVFTPYSADYKAVYAEFVMPLAGNLFLIAFAFWICLTAAIVFGAAGKNGFGVFTPLLAATLGAVYIIPMAEVLLFGPKPGFLSSADIIASSAVKSVCTVIIFILAVLLYKTAARPADPKAPQKPEAGYKLKPLGLSIKMLALPVVFCCLFYTVWYFLFWSNDNVRAFYEGPAQNPGFVPSIVSSLINESWMLGLALLKGFLYAAFALPMLFLFKGKRMIFIASVIMLYLAHPVWLLIPTPYIPDNVRIPMLIYNAVLLLVYGAVAGIMLHTSLKREEKPEAAPARRPLTPQQQALADAKAKSAQQGAPTVKQAAEVVSKTMSGKI